mgnify:CR=1 FL=1
MKVCSMDKKVLKISIILLVIVTIISLIAIYSLTPKIYLEQKEITINVFDEYNEVNYKATSLGKDVTDKVVKDGIVDIVIHQGIQQQ